MEIKLSSSLRLSLLTAQSIKQTHFKSKGHQTATFPLLGVHPRPPNMALTSQTRVTQNDLEQARTNHFSQNFYFKLNQKPIKENLRRKK